MKENKEDNNILLDTEVNDEVLQEIPLQNNKISKKNYNTNMSVKEKPLINCLRNETIIARYLSKPFALSQDPKHVFAGNMSENAFKSYTLPLTSTGAYVNPLTSDEQEYLEHVMGLEPNALSVYLKKDNYWENINVLLKKTDNYFKLDNPDDYIRYKVLLTNENLIAGSLSIFENQPKATYQYVLISETEQVVNSNVKMSINMNAYRLLGTIESDIEKLKFVVEIMGKKAISNNSSLEFVQSQAHELLQKDPKLFVTIVEDKYFSTKLLIMKNVNKGFIRKKADYYYLTSNNNPLASGNEEPTLESAAKYINEPKNQELKFLLEAQVK